MVDRVQVLKQESAALGGNAADVSPYPSAIKPQEDAIEAAGVFLQDATHRDTAVLLDRLGNDMRFQDTSIGTRTLSQLTFELGRTGADSIPFNGTAITDLTMGSKKFLGVGIATAANEALVYGQSGASLSGLAVTANIVMAGNKVTGLGAASAAGQAIGYGQAGVSLAGLAVTNSIESYGIYLQNASFIDTNVRLRRATAADEAVVEINGTAAVRVNANGIFPATTNTGNVGSETLKWASVYAAELIGGDIHMMAQDGSAHWTLIEERNRIIAFNRITGKKYKVMMAPIAEKKPKKAAKKAASRATARSKK